MKATFAARLKQAMAQTNMCQTQLSRATGIGKTSISQYLSGKNIPQDNNVDKLAKALNCSADYLLGVEDLPEPLKCTLDNITVRDAARCLGKGEQFVRIGLQRGILPFGSAVPGTGQHYIYFINADKLRDYAGAERFYSYFTGGTHEKAVELLNAQNPIPLSVG